LETWLAGNAVMKRTFKASAHIAGLIERNLPSNRKTGRQATMSSDILYDTLLKYDPDHVLMQITREEATRGLVDFGRIEEMVDRIEGRIDHVVLDRLTPMAAPLFLEPGRVPIKGLAEERLLAEETDRLMTISGLADLDQPKRWAVPF
ncbi:MAG: DNA ligase-associated DEXH box helicase, partial [Pseudomonadota bacterium]